jgi:hypothetical protein
LPVHGYYEPQDTVWISGGQMHVRLFRNRGTGHNASAAVVPMKAFGQRYGKFVETWNVSKTAVGFKSAHLLWPVDGSHCCENDFPEADWDGKKDIFAFSHNSSGRNAFWFSAGVPFSDVWHTSTIAWTPSSVTMYLDGKKLGTSSVTPTGAEEWVLQNESSLDGERAALGSSAQMNIRYVAVYSYR